MIKTPAFANITYIIITRDEKCDQQILRKTIPGALDYLNESGPVGEEVINGWTTGPGTYCSTIFPTMGLLDQQSKPNN